MEFTDARPRSLSSADKIRYLANRNQFAAPRAFTPPAEAR